MGRTILVALVVAVLASVATNLVLGALGNDTRREFEERLAAADRRADAAESRVDTALRRVDAVADRVARAERGAEEARRDAATAAAAAGASPSAEGAVLTAPDGSPYLSQAAFEQALAERLAGGRALAAAETAVAAARPPQTLAEIAADMGLTAQQEATLEVLIRDSEQELVNLLFGERSIQDVKAEILRAKEDPDLQAELIQRTLMRGVSNAGKLMTRERALRRKVEDALGKERAAEFLRRPRRPVLDPDLEDFFKDLGD